jgi:hypothetical protein
VAELNQFAVSRILGSTMKPGVRPGFGYTRGLEAVGSTLAARPSHHEQLAFSNAAEHTVLRAFGDIAQGYSVDRVLADPELSEKFYERCKALGLSASREAANRRLLVIRKNPRSRLRVPHVQRPVRLQNAMEFLYAAEFAMVELSYRYGATVDDMLANPKFGAEFDRIAATLEPKHSPVEHRLAALYIRKRRHFDSKRDRDRVTQVPLGRIANRWIDLGTLADMHLERVQNENGLLLVTESGDRERALYATEDNDLRRAAKPFAELGIYQAVAGYFWTPQPDQIRLSVAPLEKKYFGFSRRDWLLKLIQTREPIFNLPLAG